MQKKALKGYPLSQQQARLWALQGESQAYYAKYVFQLEGVLDKAALLYALQCLVRRHEILRTAFHRLPEMEMPLQVVTGHVDIYCPMIDLENLVAVSQTAHLHDLGRKLSNLEADTSLSVRLLRLSSEMHLLLICLPTLCADGFTLTRFVWELSQIYGSLQGKEDLDEETLQYADVAAWQDQLLKSAQGEGIRQYWRKVDFSQLATLGLPFERKVPIQANHAGSSQKEAFAPCVLEVSLEKRFADQISHLAQRYHVSIDAWLLACWEVALWRFGEKRDLLVGVACDGRNYEELAETLGLHTRFVPISTHIKEGLPFDQMVMSVNTSIQEVVKRQTYFTWEGAAANGTTANDPPLLFFPLCFEYERWPTSFLVPKMVFALQQRFCCIEPFLLKLSILQVGERLQLEIHYDSLRICMSQIRRLAAALPILIQSTIAQPQTSISVLPLLKPDEQASLIKLGRAPMQPLPSVQGFHQLFEAWAQKIPNQLAVISVREQLTYQQLNERANRLARVLQRRGVGPNVLVGLCLPRGAQMLVGLLAILKAGGAYLPLDPESPPARFAYQLQESQAVFLLSQQAVGLGLSEWGGRTLWLEELEQELSQASAWDLSGERSVHDLAYVMYTSGSTGMPKGVMIRQGSVVNYTQALCQLLGGEPGWHYAMVSTLAADLGYTAIFCALASGGCVQVLATETLMSAEAMTRWVEQYPIDVLKIVPSHLSALLMSEGAKELMPRRALVLGGEILPVSLRERLAEVGGTCQVYNHYGPTETTIGVLVNELGRLERRDEEVGEPEGKRTGMTIPLGRPIANSEVYVLDNNMHLVPVGTIGEVYLAGAGLAMGYIHQPEQTAERFVPHPWSQQAGARLYRTGDRAYYDEEGRVAFVGRRDRQVKLRGYRIELAEIEAVLRHHPQVWDCVVVLQEENLTTPRLIGYVVARTASGLTAEVLREMLKQHIPAYMVPAHIVMVETLPLTPNGKVDWRQLPKPEQVVDKGLPAQREPRNPLEEVLVTIWKELLKVPTVGIHDNFFAMGGHSLLITRLIARIRAVLQVELPVKVVFDAPTVAELAHIVKQQVLEESQGIEISPLRVMERPEMIPLSFAQQRLWFLDQLQPGSTTYLSTKALRFQGVLNARALQKSFEELVYRQESLRTIFPAKAGQPLQVILPIGNSELPVIDLQGLGLERREQEVRLLTIQEAQHPCDLARGPLLRTYLLRQEVQTHVLLLTLHHIITDAWSYEVLVRELTTLYRASVFGKPASLAPLPLQYADFALWQRQGLQERVFETQRAYWKKQLTGSLRSLKLPADRPRPEVETFRGANLSVMIPADLTAELKNLSQREGVTLFMTLLSALKVLLVRICGQENIAIGTLTAGRTHTELEGLIGFFINTLVMRTDLSDNPSFLAVLQRVRQVVLEAYTHQDLPFEEIVKVVQPERTKKGSPLFQVMFDLHHPLPVPELSALPGASLSVPELSSLTLSPLEFEFVWTVKFDLIVIASDTQQGMHVLIRYNTDLFNADTIALLLKQFRVLLESIVRQPTKRIGALEILTVNERRQSAMEQKARKESYFKHLKNIEPKVINLQQTTMVTVENLRPEASLPLVVRPAMDDIDVVGWMQANLEFVQKKLLEHGALLFRGFNVSTVPIFEQFAQAMCQELFNENGEHPRESISGNVYTPTFYPKEKHLLWHNENSFNYQWPMKIWFGCVKPAEHGGETPIVDSRKMFECIDPKIRERFQQKNILYVRNYRKGLGLSWQEVFRSSSRAVVEERCRKDQIDFEWKEDDCLMTRSLRPAVARHPETGEWSWFNQAQHWHISCLDSDTRDALQSLFDVEDMPRNCYYGDGSPIEDSIMDEICALYRQLEVVFPWQKGDVLLLDNMLTAHARNAYEGERKLLVAMGEMFNQNMLDKEGSND